MVLSDIQQFCQESIEEMAGVYNVNIEIIDNELRFVAAVGRYANRIGMLLPAYGGRLSIKAISTKEYIFIETPRTHPICMDCHNLENCQDKVELCYPIISGDVAVGVISMASVSGGQAAEMLARRDALMLSVSLLSKILGEKLMDCSREFQLDNARDLLGLALNSMEASAMVIRDGSRIVLLNKRCEQLLGFNVPQLDYLTRVKQMRFSAPTTHDDMTEYTIKLRDKTHHLTGQLYPKNAPTSGNDRLFILTDTVSSREVHAPAKKPPVCCFHALVGESSAYLKAIEFCKDNIYTDNCLLLCGESGVGKETIARAMHNEGPRNNNSFIRVTASSDFDSLFDPPRSAGDAAIAENSLEAISEERLRGNTLYIAEVGMLSHTNQERLVGILSRCAFYNCKVICATAFGLRQLSDRADFLKNLYYTIELNAVTIPPLRDRGRDVQLLADHFIGMNNAALGRNLLLSEEVLDLFMGYGWHGNIHELESVITFIIESHDTLDERISLRSIPETLLVRFRRYGNASFNLENAERELILRALNEYGKGPGAKTAVAKSLGISVATLYRKLKSYDIHNSDLFH